MEKLWVRVCQEAGPLRKECRYQRPTWRKSDSPSVRREKNRISKEMTKTSCFRRTPVDRLELILALLGFDVTMYTLTFREDALPPSYSDVKKLWDCFARSMRKAWGGAFDYVKAIEGRHGDHRYHIHIVLRNQDFSPQDVRRAWPGGSVHVAPTTYSEDYTFRDRAAYLCKEQNGGCGRPLGVRTWSAARGLTGSLLPTVRCWADSGDVNVPDDATWIRTRIEANAYGRFSYASYVIVQ